MYLTPSSFVEERESTIVALNLSFARRLRMFFLDFFFFPHCVALLLIARGCGCG